MEYSLIDDTVFLAFQIANGMAKGFIFGVVGFVFITILIQNDSIFSFYRPFIQKMVFGAKYQRINETTKKIESVLTGCPKCFSGQLAFWGYLFGFVGLFGWASCVCTAILFAKLLDETNK